VAKDGETRPVPVGQLNPLDVLDTACDRRHLIDEATRYSQRSVRTPVRVVWIDRKVRDPDRVGLRSSEQDAADNLDAFIDRLAREQALRATGWNLDPHPACATRYCRLARERDRGLYILAKLRLQWVEEEKRFDRRPHFRRQAGDEVDLVTVLLLSAPVHRLSQPCRALRVDRVVVEATQAITIPRLDFASEIRVTFSLIPVRNA
jgi:hypothetical protein